MTDLPASTTTSSAIVIGAGLGGLAAAMRLGAKGYHVTLLDRLDCLGGRGSAITQDGHRFDLGPTIVTVPELFEKLWQDCGRDFRTDVALKPIEPFYEIRWPDGSNFFAYRDTEKMVQEVARLNKDDIPGYLQFLKDSEQRYKVGYEGMLTRPMHRIWETLRVLPEFARLRADRSIYGLAAARVKDERLRMALSFHPLFIGGDPTHVTSIYALVAHLEKEYGVHYAIGGVQSIAEAMGRVVRMQGGSIRMESEVDEILIENGAATGVRLSTGEELKAGIVIANADPGHTYSHLLRGHKKRRWTPAKLRRKRWSMSLYVWYFGTKGTASAWPDLGHHTIVNGPRYKGLLEDIFLRGRLSEDMSLYIHRPSRTDPGAAPPGDDTFYVLSPVPHLGWRSSVDWQAEDHGYRDKIAAVLEGVMPGFREKISTEFAFTPETFRDRYLSPHGCGFSIEPRILQSAWFRPHNVSEEARGLFLVGAGTHPGAGMPGVVASAEVVADMVPDLADTVVQRMAAE